MASESRLLSRLRRAARGVYVLSLFASFAAFMNINSSGIGGLLGENSIPFSIGAEGSLNVHSCVADFLVSSLRDLTYVTFDQVLPEKVVFPVCDSTSGPLCPHLKFPLLLPEAESERMRRPYGISKQVGAYSAHLHRPLLVDAGGEAPSSSSSSSRGVPALVQLDTSRTFLHSEPVSASRIQRHSVEEPYAIRGQYLEDGIGDVSSPTFSDAISSAIGHLGAIVSSMREIWGPKSTTESESFVCFHAGDREDRSDCHDLSSFSSLPPHYEAEVEAFHSGWSGSSRLLQFDRSKSPFISPFLEDDYAVGLPEAETRWKGRWRVKPTRGVSGPEVLKQQQQQQQRQKQREATHALPLTGVIKEGFTAKPSSYASVLNLRGPPVPISTYAELDSHQGSFLHSNLFVPYGIWVSATPREPNPSCSKEAREQSRNLVLVIQGLQDEELVFTAEVPLREVLGLHAASEEGEEVAPEFRFVNALDYMKTSPLQRIDVLRFLYGYTDKTTKGADRITFRRPLDCSGLRGVLGALHLLIAEKTLSNRIYYAVDITTPEGKVLQEKAHAIKMQQQQQQTRKQTLTDAKAPLIKQLLGGATPRPWKPHKLEIGSALRADIFSGEETDAQKEGGVFLGVVLRSQQDRVLQLLEPNSISSSSLPVSWQENNRIKFGRFDAMPYQFADLRKPLKKGFLFLQDIPAEAPVLSLNQISQLKHVFFRKPVAETHGRFKNVDLESAGIGDLRSLMKSILSSIETKKNPGAAAASLLDKLSKDKAKEITAHAHPAPDPSEAAAADDSTEATQTEAAEEGDPMQVIHSNIAKSLTTLAETLAKSSPSFKDLLQKVSTPIEGGVEDSSIQSEGSNGSSVSVNTTEEDKKSSSSSSSSSDAAQQRKESAGPSNKTKSSKTSKTSKDAPQAAVQAVLIMGPDGQVINFDGPAVSAAEAFSNLPETFLSLARQMGAAIGAEGGEEMLKAVASAAAAAAAAPAAEAAAAAPAAAVAAEQNKSKEDKNKKQAGGKQQQMVGDSSDEGPEAASPSSSSSKVSSSSKTGSGSKTSNSSKTSSSSKSSNNSNSSSSKTSNSSKTSSSSSSKTSSNKGSSSKSSNTSSNSNSDKEKPSMPEVPEGLFGEALKVMLHADNSVISALIRTAETHAQRILAANGAANLEMPPASFLTNVLKGLQQQASKHAQDKQDDDEL